jgi:hypothetical protein
MASSGLKNPTSVGEDAGGATCAELPAFVNRRHSIPGLTLQA